MFSGIPRDAPRCKPVPQAALDVIVEASETGNKRRLNREALANRRPIAGEHGCHSDLLPYNDIKRV